jgi:hypothetical protein
VKKLIVLGAGAVGATAVSVVFGTGVASADAYAGQTYADASSALSDAGETGIIASRIGGQLPDDECTVIRSQNAPFVSSIDFTHVSSTVQLYLNCNGTLASAGKPGSSLASPEGQATAAAAAEKAAEEQAAAQQSQADELLATGNAPGVPGDVAQ